MISLDRKTQEERLREACISRLFETNTPTRLNAPLRISMKPHITTAITAAVVPASTVVAAHNFAAAADVL